MSYREDGPSGIGGWLAFFLVTLGLITPGSMIVNLVTTLNSAEIASAYGERWPMVAASELLIGSLGVLGAWFLAFRLIWIRNWRSVQIAKIGLWVLSIGFTSLELLAVSLFGGMSLDILLAAAAPGLIRTVGYPLVWSLYLHNSVRVANTYGDTPETEDGLEQVFE